MSALAALDVIERLPARSRTVDRMIAGCLVILAMIGIAVGASVYQQRGSEAVRHALAVDGILGRVLSAVQDAETGQRGYLLTGDAIFLTPFRDGRAKVSREIARLHALLREDDSQRDALDTLIRLIRDKLDELGTTIELHRSGDPDASRDLVRQGRGRQVMDEIRAVVGRMEEHEATLMEQRQATISRVALLIWSLLAAVVIALVLFAMSATREASRRRSLSRFLPQELVSRLADDDGSLRTGRRQQAVIAFVDMRGSTAIAERLDPQQLTAFLSAFRRRVMRLSRLHGGVVDKFIGDGALVVFGLPEPADDDAARAVAFARDLVEVIARWNDKGEHDATVRIGIGLHCGEVFSGIIGEDARYEFTVLGDTVNVAARLEQATKSHGVSVLASEAVRRAAGASTAGWREISREPLRGRREAMAYYAVEPPASADPGGADFLPGEAAPRNGDGATAGARHG
ncbi:CHASE3 domain-containing protein [Methylobacterium sp. J-076]|uniref:adenylate/guanylate cyclase domain-containing protein n=1 Tax=Methylobacterium sp. J-076 TaxID=2836655 RepID=UPI001FBB68AB|nr:CHASE3 domain-containing protein [Methylobacterium sp. J-076]MCJ2010947.1 CHASE3 domain-containing protein [Methylobacterium sp. J-076]